MSPSPATEPSAFPLPAAWKEGGLLAVPLLSAWAELILREQYHRVAAEPTRFAYLFALTLLSLLLHAGASGRQAPTGPVLRVVNRWLVFGAWVWIVPMAGASAGVWASRAAAPSLLMAVALTAGFGWLASGEARWRRSRAALALATALFVGAQPLLVATAGAPLRWPDATAVRDAASAPAPGAPREGVVVLLLDELNARDGRGLGEALARGGLTVTWRSVDPIADGTAKVIPAIWTGQAFPDPKPCAPTAICSMGRVLDFARVTASRPDVDVIGFYHPYCAMQGLRSCVRLILRSPLADGARWGCAIARRVGGTADPDCVLRAHAPWIGMQDASIAALLEVPFWRQGGVLYAHLPLPHLPGRRSGGTVAAHYEDNLRIASAMLEDLARRLRASGFERARVVVFSDHPLRPAMWCGMPSYRRAGCLDTTPPEDPQVPLIVGSLGVPAPDLSPFATNAGVFALSRLPPR